MTLLKERPMLSVVEVAPRNERELVIARLIAAPPEALYRCWTEPRLLERWFAPKPLTTKVLEQDLRVGGVQAITMTSPDGQEFPAGGVYLALEPGRRVVFTSAFKEGWQPDPSDFAFVGEITFEPQADGRTLYTARAGHWDAATTERHRAMGFHDGWGQCAEQLAELAAGL
ncbi:MAG: hypothetical protein JWP73_1109 [Phenylobacterium sp.]|nr:hypothetical protein [Phenylobacterium sp.]